MISGESEKGLPGGSLLGGVETEEGHWNCEALVTVTVTAGVSLCIACVFSGLSYTYNSFTNPKEV